MTRGEAIKAFLKNCLLPVMVAVLLFFLFRSACVKDGSIDYFLLWLLCGLPFGIHRMFLWIIPGGRSFGGSIAVFALNLLIGAVIGGVVLVRGGPGGRGGGVRPVFYFFHKHKN